MPGIPKAFLVKGTKPTTVKSTCKICNLKYTDHTGMYCAICKDADEHHTAAKFEECREGLRRMARARYLADIELSDLDRLSLADG